MKRENPMNQSGNNWRFVMIYDRIWTCLLLFNQCLWGRKDEPVD